MVAMKELSWINLEPVCCAMCLKLFTQKLSWEGRLTLKSKPTCYNFVHSTELSSSYYEFVSFTELM